MNLIVVQFSKYDLKNDSGIHHRFDACLYSLLTTVNVKIVQTDPHTLLFLWQNLCLFLFSFIRLKINFFIYGLALEWKTFLLFTQPNVGLLFHFGLFRIILAKVGPCDIFQSIVLLFQGLAPEKIVFHGLLRSVSTQNYMWIGTLYFH